MRLQRLINGAGQRKMDNGLKILFKPKLASDKKDQEVTLSLLFFKAALLGIVLRAIETETTSHLPITNLPFTNGLFFA